MSLEFPQELQQLLKELGPVLYQASKIWKNLDIDVRRSTESEEKINLTEVMQTLLNRVSIVIDLSSQHAKSISENHQKLLDWLENEAKVIAAQGEKEFSEDHLGCARGYREVAEAIRSGIYLQLEDDSDVEEDPSCPCHTAS